MLLSLAILPLAIGLQCDSLSHIVELLFCRLFFFLVFVFQSGVPEELNIL